MKNEWLNYVPFCLMIGFIIFSISSCQQNTVAEFQETKRLEMKIQAGVFKEAT